MTHLRQADDALLVVLGQQRQAGVVGVAQRFVVGHGVQVADGRPGLRQPVLQRLERLDHRVEGGGGGGGDLLELAAAGAEQLAHRRLDVLGANLGEGRQHLAAQQRVVHGGNSTRPACNIARDVQPPI